MLPKPIRLVGAANLFHFSIRNNQTKIELGENMNNTAIIIPKGTSISLSELGYNNFYYPTFNKCTILTEDIEVEQLSWIGGGTLSAYKVTGQKNVIWIEKKYV